MTVVHLFDWLDYLTGKASNCLAIFRIEVTNVQTKYSIQLFFERWNFFWFSDCNTE